MAASDYSLGTATRGASTTGAAGGSLSAESERAGLFHTALMRLVDGCLVVAIAGVPLVMGGRVASGHPLLVVSTSLAAALFCFSRLSCSDRQFRGTKLEWLWLAAIGLVGLQLAMLGPATLDQLSPHIRQLLPLWQPPSDLLPASVAWGTWSTISLVPFNTWQCGQLLIAHALLYFVVSQRIRSLRDVDYLLKLIAVLTVVMAAFGIAQYLVCNEKFFWVYRHPLTKTSLSASGSFTNRNHFAQFVALGIGPLLYCLVASRQQLVGRSMGGLASFSSSSRSEDSARGTSPRRSKNSSRGYGQSRSMSLQSFDTGSGSRGQVLLERVLPITGLAICGLAIVLSQSRGGLVAGGLALLVGLSALVQQKAVSTMVLLPLLGAAMVMALVLALPSASDVTSRMDDWSSDDRWKIWHANYLAFCDFRWVGTGLGSHSYIYPLYLKVENEPYEYTHAESSYMQMLSETGLAGTVLAVLAIVVIGAGLLNVLLSRQVQQGGLAASALLACLAAHLFHAGCDFLWYIPGVMVLVVTLAALARIVSIEAATVSGQKKPGTYLPGIVWLAGCIGVATVGWNVTCATLPSLAAATPWEQYQRLTFGTDSCEQLEENLPEAKLKVLMQAAKAQPADPQTQIRLGAACLRLFDLRQSRTEDSLTLDQLRDAAAQSGFASTEQQTEWLKRCTGKNFRLLEMAIKHLRRGLTGSPLVGEAYLYWDEVAFVENAVDSDAYRTQRQLRLKQALAARPRSPIVLLRAGRDSILDRELKQALAYWNLAMKIDSAFEDSVLDLTTTTLPAAEFTKAFQPNWSVSKKLLLRYHPVKQRADYEQALQYLADVSIAQAKKSPITETANYLVTAASCYEQLGRSDLSRRCYDAALKRDPGNLMLHRDYGKWLYGKKDFAEATEHLSWFAMRNPDDLEINEMLEVAAKERLRN
jgi:tetratricopeptide (TPR) repeat protein